MIHPPRFYPAPGPTSRADRRLFARPVVRSRRISMSRFLDRVLAGALAAAVVLGCAVGARAQAVKGGLLGNVVDQAGQPMPGVTVTITEVSTNLSYTAVTNESGYYIFANLKDGTY